MADNFSVQATIQLLTGTTLELERIQYCTGSCSEPVFTQISLAPAASDVFVAFGSATLPKMVTICGALGVSARLMAAPTGTVLSADTLLVLSNSAGFSQTGIFLSNSGAQSATVRLIAAE